MSKLIYIDTNIYLDLFENRSDRFRPLGEIAGQLFNRALNCEFNIIVSSLVLKEIVDNGHHEDYLTLFNNLRTKNKIKFIEENFKDRAYANDLKNLRKTPFQDTCHVAIALRAGANLLITRNIKDFQNLKDLIEIESPDLI